MGRQISIKHQDMVAAGWKHVEQKEPVYGNVEEGEPEVLCTRSFYVFEKGDDILRGYGGYDFYADCSSGGNNESLFDELGLFDLPHEFS